MRAIRLFVTLLILYAATLVAGPSPSAGAERAITFTETVNNQTETFSDVLFCEYASDTFTIEITYNAVFHITLLPNGTYHVTGTSTGTFVATPDDPSLPTFTGRFTQWFGENSNLQNANGTFTFTVHGTGSDGSRLTFHVTAHFGINANGGVVEFEKPSC